MKYTKKSQDGAHTDEIKALFFMNVCFNDINVAAILTYFDSVDMPDNYDFPAS